MWYDVHSANVFKGGRTLSLPVTLDTVSLEADPELIEIRLCRRADVDLLPFPGSFVPAWRLGGLQVNRKRLLHG